MRGVDNLVDLYTDYLIATSGSATATELSDILDNTISHDKFTRMLKEEAFDARYLWKRVKKVVREIEDEDGCLIVDDTIVEKEWTDENEIVCYHYDHTKGKSVKGFNILNMLYYNKDISIPIGFEVIKKTEVFIDKDGKRKRRSDKTKNELLREMIAKAINNRVKFRYILADSWFSSKENFEFIDKKGKHFIMALKSNRLFALSKEDKYRGNFIPVDTIELKDKEAIKGYIKGYDKEVSLVRRVFTNKDGNIATLNLICSDTSLQGKDVVTIYQRRWKVEEYHKSLKSNASLSKSPTKRVVTQISHLVMSMVAVFKLECLKIKQHLNHFALKSKIMLKANLMAMKEIRRMQYG